MKVLSALNLSKINDHQGGKYLTCARPGGDNKNGIVIYPETLAYLGTTSGKSGDIFTLVMDVKGCSFPEAIQFIAQTLHIEEAGEKTRLPFGGFYKALHQEGSLTPDFTYLDEAALPPERNFSQKYFADGVSFTTQDLFQIRMNLERNEIWIPQKDTGGRLIGVKSRSNDKACPHDKRFYAPYPYPKSEVVYGFSENYKAIIEKQTAVIFEAEKSVCQAHSFGMKRGLAVEGHSISRYQAKLIKSLGARKLILAFDSDVPYEQAEFEAKKLLLKNTPYKNRIFVLSDKTQRYLKKEDKASPTDFGRRTFEQLIRNSLIEIKE